MTKTAAQKAARKAAKKSKKSIPVVERKTTTTTVSAPVIKGRGDYKVFPGISLPNKEPGLASLGGQSWGRRIGNVFGAGDVGNAIHSGIKSIFGWGDYRVRNSRQNSRMQGNNHSTDVDQVLGGDPAMFVGGGVPCIKHREFLGLIKSTKNFTKTEYPINPGLVDTFPWLHGIARNFTKYRIDGMVVEFRSRIGNAVSGTGSLGTVIIGTQYDPTEPSFSSEMMMENNEFTVSQKPSENFYHMVECDPKMGNQLLCVRESVPNGDLRLYDKGRLAIATVGQVDDNQVLGELWISYKISFIIPMLPLLSTPTPVTNTQLWGRTMLSAGANIISPLSNSYGNVPVTFVGWSPGSTLTPAVRNDYGIGKFVITTDSLPIGNYMMLFSTVLSSGQIYGTSNPFTVKFTGVTGNNDVYKDYPRLGSQMPPFTDLTAPVSYGGVEIITATFTKSVEGSGTVTFAWDLGVITTPNSYVKSDVLWLFQYSSNISAPVEETKEDRLISLEKAVRELTLSNNYVNISDDVPDDHEVKSHDQQAVFSLPPRTLYKSGAGAVNR